jgi:hypothetical protein
MRFLKFSVKVVRHTKAGFLLWKAVEKAGCRAFLILGKVASPVYSFPRQRRFYDFVVFT